MTQPSEVARAFAHPEARAEATAPAGPLDRISLRDHVIEVEIGAFETERGMRQRLRIDIALELAPADPGAVLHDDVDRVLSYDRLAGAVAEELALRRLNLLETLAEGVAARLLAEPRALRVFIRIEKLDRGPGALGVEIARSRPWPQDQPARDLAEGAARAPLVVLMPAPVSAPVSAPDDGGHEGGGADPLAVLAARAAGRVLLVCPGLPAARPCTPDPAAQRRIDLLALDQAAWAMAGRLPGALVVASRTEIAWALAQPLAPADTARVVIWAPSRLVLDSPGPAAPPASVFGAALPAALAGWLADLLALGPVLDPDVALSAVVQAPAAG